jgi:hypothetical protein
MVGRRELQILAMVGHHELQSRRSRHVDISSGLTDIAIRGDRQLDARAVGAEAWKLSMQTLEVAPLPGA